MIVTKDADFSDRSAVVGHPPKVVWIQMGNCTTDEIASALCRSRVQLEALDAHADLAVLSLLG